MLQRSSLSSPWSSLHNNEQERRSCNGTASSPVTTRSATDNNHHHDHHYNSNQNNGQHHNNHHHRMNNNGNNDNHNHNKDHHSDHDDEVRYHNGGNGGGYHDRKKKKKHKNQGALFSGRAVCLACSCSAVFSYFSSIYMHGSRQAKQSLELLMQDFQMIAPLPKRSKGSRSTSMSGGSFPTDEGGGGILQPLQCTQFLDQVRSDSHVPVVVDPNIHAASGVHNNITVRTKTLSPFYISLHGRMVDRVRWCIYRNGKYYESALETIWTHLVRAAVLRRSGTGTKSKQYRSIAASRRRREHTAPVVVLDVGGNIGYYSLHSASLGKSVQVYSFEPNLKNALRFCESIGMNRNFDSRIHIYPYGVSQKSGVVNFFDVSHNPGAGQVEPDDGSISVLQQQLQKQTVKGERRQITVTTLDEFATQRGWIGRRTGGAGDDGPPPPRITILKIDAERHEAAVVLGGRKLFRSGLVRNVFTEAALEGNVDAERAALQLLVDCGYRLVGQGDWKGPGHPSPWPHDQGRLVDNIMDGILQRSVERNGTAPFINLWWSLDHNDPDVVTALEKVGQQRRKITRQILYGSWKIKKNATTALLQLQPHRRRRRSTSINGGDGGDGGDGGGDGGDGNDNDGGFAMMEPVDCGEFLHQGHVNKKAVTVVRDPNYDLLNGTRIYNITVQTKTASPFYISLHERFFDRTRWCIARNGWYYETALERIWTQILRNHTKKYNNNGNNGNGNGNGAAALSTATTTTMTTATAEGGQPPVPVVPPVVLDVGGNIGYYALHSASLANNVHVHSFEPNLKNIMRFCESVTMNGWDYMHQEDHRDRRGRRQDHLHHHHDTTTARNGNNTNTDTTTSNDTETTTTTATNDNTQPEEQREQQREHQQHSTVRIYPFGLSDQPGTMTFFEDGGNPGQGQVVKDDVIAASAARAANNRSIAPDRRIRHSLQVTTLDAFARRQGWLVDDDDNNVTTSDDGQQQQQQSSPPLSPSRRPVIAILKVDVERHEAHVLLGGRKLINSGMVRNIFTEAALEGNVETERAALQLLVDAGYKLAGIGDWRGPGRPNPWRDDDGNINIVDNIIRGMERRAHKERRPFINMWWTLPQK